MKENAGNLCVKYGDETQWPGIYKLYVLLDMCYNCIHF